MRIEITVEGQEPVTHKLVKEKTLLGSGQECDLIVEAEGLSRKHLMILAEGDQFFVVDQGSTNGAFINEERLVPGQRASFTSFFPVKLGALVTLALLSDEESAKTFDFASDLASKEKTSPGRTSPGIPVAEGKTPAMSRAGFSTAPTAAKRPARGEGGRPGRKSSAEQEDSQSQLIKILAFVVAVGGSALFFYMKEDPAEIAAAQQAAVAVAPKPPEVKLSDFEIRPLKPTGLERAPMALSELKCSTEEELLLCRGLGLPVEGYGLSGAVFAQTYMTVVLPALKGEELATYFAKDATWDDAVKTKMQNVTDPRDLIAMFIVNSPLDVWARLNGEKKWMYVLFVSNSGVREGDLWVADLTYLRSLGPKPEEFYTIQRNFRAMGAETLAPLAGLFRRVPEAAPADTLAP